MRAQRSLILTTLVLVTAIVTLKQSPTLTPSHANEWLSYRGSGRVETAYRGSGRVEIAYRGSGRITVA